jgi:hypothetical protein
MNVENKHEEQANTCCAPSMTMSILASPHLRYPFFPSPLSQMFLCLIWSTAIYWLRQTHLRISPLSTSSQPQQLREPELLSAQSAPSSHLSAELDCKFKLLEAEFYSCEYVDEHIVACINISGCLIHLDFRIVGRNGGIY